MMDEYIKKTLGFDFIDKGTAIELVKSLPLYLKGMFDYSLIEIDGQEFLLLTPSDEVDISTKQVVDFVGQIERQTGKQVLVRFKSLDNAKRRVLISNKVNFVVVDKQIYLPALSAYLNEGGSVQGATAKIALSPAAQSLLLYHLQVKSFEGVPFKDMAEVLGYSKKTITLVAAELQALSICDIEQIDAWIKVLRFPLKGRELWDSVSPLMSTPIHKVWHIERDAIPTDLPLCSSYDTALAHYTFIADSSQLSFAIDKRVFAEYQESLQPFLHPEEGTVRLEVWKYDPALLSDGQFVDKLSLALCYRDTHDERVQNEITELINNIVW